MKQEFTIRPEAHYTFDPTPKLLNLKNGDFCVGKVTMYNTKRQLLYVDLGNKKTGIIPKSEVTIYEFTYSRGFNSDTTSPHQIAHLVGKTIYCQVKYYDSEQDLYILSRKDSMMATYNYIVNNPDNIFESVITKIAPYGVFVDLGNGITSLVHVTECSTCRYTDLTIHFKEGDIIPLKIKSIEPEPDNSNFRLHVSRKLAFPGISEASSIYNENDIVRVKFCTPTLCNDGYFVEVTPHISGIIDNNPDVKFYEGLSGTASIKKITPNGLRLRFIEVSE